LQYNVRALLLFRSVANNRFALAMNGDDLINRSWRAREACGNAVNPIGHSACAKRVTSIDELARCINAIERSRERSTKMDQVIKDFKR
jgi:hypothetical protein